MSQKKDIIFKITQYIEHHLSEDLSLDHIAEYAGYSKFHLNRLFMEENGCTIYKYIKERRLTEAAKRLVQTDNSIADIAYEAKYESQQAFTLAFRQLFLYPPNVYRQLGIFIPKHIDLLKDKNKYNKNNYFNKKEYSKINFVLYYRKHNITQKGEIAV